MVVGVAGCEYAMGVLLESQGGGDAAVGALVVGAIYHLRDCRWGLVGLVSVVCWTVLEKS